MVQSVELLLDADLDARVRAQWRALVEAGLPSLGRHTGATNAPHVTLTVASGVGPAHEDALADALPPADLPLPLLLGGYVVFGSHKHVLARLVVPSARLLDLHARAASAWADALEVAPTGLPGRWTPHVTLASHLTDTQLGQALTALRGLDEAVHDGTGSAVEVRRWDGTAKEAWALHG
ncbi:2'-5' RNA ligase family protein [Aquipuribacter hungaricus]|uniref:2'-5' RNA ligase family protein n=1 Tax=Aquipuribacter hungaricus TaxID=545624 RepID=A0ABV7WIJ3_9MICO